MIGERIRHIRQSQERPLSDIAARAKISVATLSRIENDKQAVDLELFLVLARVLKVSPTDLLNAEIGETEADPLARRIATLEVKDRTELWRDLAVERRSQRGRKTTSHVLQLTNQVEEMLAHIDFLREELESMKARMKRKR
ncbi:MAG TPA: helix-turn-helix transcriptional regulator [Thermoanaerobaculia bacterium]|jgi:transcriptional regulator with XRE-family HTH domain